ncbi:MAG: YjbQ family protein [Candidatus Marinimicrobia bacterium]|nr:YjbQ family protein [Candidatus Neomarinimicrobiota bacterium]
MPSQFSVNTRSSTEFVNVTSQVQNELQRTEVKNGVCTVYVPHTTAGITINEGADPNVAKDILMEINKIVPMQDGYTHSEGNSAAHIKTSLFGSSVQIPVEEGRLTLGTWQSIFLCEFDGPRNRRVIVQVVGK